METRHGMNIWIDLLLTAHEQAEHGLSFTLSNITTSASLLSQEQKTLFWFLRENRKQLSLVFPKPLNKLIFPPWDWNYQSDAKYCPINFALFNNVKQDQTWLVLEWEAIMKSQDCSLDWKLEKMV